MDASPQDATTRSDTGAVAPSPALPGSCSAETGPRSLKPVNYGVETRHFKKYGYGVVVFIREYTQDFNLTRSSAVAWPEKTGISQTGHGAACLRDPEILALIDAEMDRKRQVFMVDEPEFSPKACVARQSPDGRIPNTTNADEKYFTYVSCGKF